MLMIPYVRLPDATTTTVGINCVSTERKRTAAASKTMGASARADVPSGSLVDEVAQEAGDR